MISKTEIKRLKSLKHKKYRKQYNQFLIEGIRLTEEAVSGNEDIVNVWHLAETEQESRLSHLIKNLEGKNIPHEAAFAEELDKISDTVNNQGIVALVNIPQQLKVINGKNENWLFLDEIRDPGNFGTILRTADWFGINHIALSNNCVDPYNPKVLRSGMGAHFHLTIYPDIDLRQIKEMGHTIIAADPYSESIVTFHASQHKKLCLVLGSEAHGISDEIKPLVDQFLAIPGDGKAESLNVAVAAGIFMYLLQS